MTRLSRTQLFIATLVGLLVLGTIAEAVIPAIRGSGLQVDLNATTPIAASKAGLWGKSADGLPYWRKTDGTDVSMAGGGGGGTTQTIDVINATAATAKVLTAAAANAGTNVAFTFDNSTTLAGTTQLASFKNNTSEKVAIHDDGSIGTASGIFNAALSYGVKLFNGYVEITGGTLGADGDNTRDVGASSVRWKDGWFSGAIKNTAAVGHLTTMADGASAVAAYADTSTAWTNTGAKLLSLRTNGVEKIYVGQPALADFWELRSSTTFIGLRNSGATGFTAQGTSGFFYVGGSANFEWSNSVYRPTNDVVQDLGVHGSRWKTVFAKFHETSRGAQLTAATSITPTTGLHHVTGATTIDTIATTNLAANSNPQFTILADGGTITWSAAGNIKKAGTVTQDNMQIFVWDATDAKWYPQQ